MRVPRKLAVAVATIPLLLLAMMIALPLAFRGRITERVKGEINENVEARVDWSGVGLTLFRNFPNLTFRLDDLTVTGIDRFEGDTLAAIGSLRLVLDMGSVLRSLSSGEQIVVRSIDVNRPVVNLRVLEDGTANWDIAKRSSDAPVDDAPSAVEVSLRRFEIRDATITYDDRQTGLAASLTGYRQSLSGDFRQDFFVIQTSAHGDELSVRFAGVPYLNKVRLDVKADVEADMSNRRFTFKENEVRLNDLMIGFAGSARVTDDHVALDVAFNAPTTDFRHILSLVPAIYAREFQTVQTSGTMALSGRVNGNYGDDAFPSFALEVTVENGTFRYPDLPLPARDISVDLAVVNAGGDADSTVVNLRRFHVVVGSEPIDAAMVLRTPVSDPDVDFRLAGKLNLADLNRTMKLEGVEELTGTVGADVAVRTRMSFVDRQQYDRITARGSADARSIRMRWADLSHAVIIDEAVLQLTPRHAELRSFKGSIGSSDMQLAGYLDNLIGYVMRDEELRGRATITSRRFDLNEWQADDEATEVIPVPANIDFVLQATVAQLAYGKLEMTNARGGLRVKDRRVTLEDFRMNLLGGELGMTGFYETTDVSRPTFDANLRMTGLDIPAAAAAFVTVQMLAPVARYARGSFSADMRMSGPLGKDMTPLFDALNGRGSIETTRLVLQDFPLMERLADAVKIPQLSDPTLEAIRSLIEIRGGRLHVSPFDVAMAGGDLRMNIGGSNGIDQSIDYAVRLQIPRALLGAEANRAVASLVTQTGRAGLNLEAAETVALGIQIGGTVTNPSVRPDAGSVTTSVREGVEQAARQEVARTVADVEQRVDSAAEAARREARAEADRIIRDAELRAQAVREEAQRLAETVRKEGYEQADALLERATNPIARTAAQPAADRLRREADQKADRIVREADSRADGMVEEARKRANDLAGPPE